MTRRKKILGAGVVIVVLLVAAIIWWLNSSNEGQISDPTPTTQKHQAATGTKQLQGKYIHFSYPGTYLARELPAKDIDLELYQLTASTTYDKRLMVIVTQLPDGKLENNSAYLLRKTRSDMYHERQATTTPLKAQIWVAADGREQTVFIQQGSRVTILSFTQQGGSADDLTTEVDTMLRSFGWN